MGWKTTSTAYRSGVLVAIGTAFLLLWINGAVGIIGSENDNANLMYFGVLAVGIIGALIGRFGSQGMARALCATAFAQAVVVVIALIAGWGAPVNSPLQIVALNGAFIALWLGSAWLFRKAARE